MNTFAEVTTTEFVLTTPMLVGVLLGLVLILTFLAYQRSTANRSK